jgi:hypothetical protein
MDPLKSPSPPDPPPGATIATERLLARLEAISRERPDRVLRLYGTVPALTAEAGTQAGEHSEAVTSSVEPFELVIYRGFSSSTTHPTAFDPDQPALGTAARIEAAELLRGPLNPAAEERLAGPAAVEAFLEPTGWG